MRLQAELIAESDAEYVETYHYDFRSRLLKALRGTEYEDEHETGEPMPMAFSNPFPYPASDGRIEEGDRLWMRIASPDRELLNIIAGDLGIDSEIGSGEMRFHIEDFDLHGPDVGPRGSTGVLRTDTGVVCRIPPHRREEYGIDAPEDSVHGTFWRREHAMDPFVTGITNNLNRKHDRFGERDRRGANDLDHDLFDTYDLDKTYALPLTVTRGETHQYVLSKWDLGYTVESEDHRRLLNLLLDVGIGEKNSYGFGFVNVRDQQRN